MPSKPKTPARRAAPKQPARSPLSDIERATALEAVLNHAPEMGIEGAIKKFGGPLTKVEKDLIRTLTPEEVTQLRNIKRKLGVFHGPGPSFI